VGSSAYVCGSTELMNKRMAPKGFMVYFLPADKQEKGWLFTHTIMPAILLSYSLMIGDH
jgi:hypothetical protein